MRLWLKNAKNPSKRTAKPTKYGGDHDSLP